MSKKYQAKYQKLTARLRSSRLKAELTQMEAGKKLKKPQAYLSKIERGKRGVDAVELGELAKVYNKDISFSLNKTMENETKSYNPFKMLGSWVGFALGMLAIPSAYVANHVVFLHPFAWAYFLGVQMDWEGVGILAVLTLQIVFFIYGWGIHSFFRKIGRENPIMIAILVSMLVILPVTYGLIKDYLTLQDTLNHADLYINSAKALPDGSARNAQDFSREATSMNAVIEMAKAEKNIPTVINKMLTIAADESLAIDVRLTALESLFPKIGQMNTNEKKTLSDQLVSLSDHVSKSSQLSDMNKERMAGRISMLQKSL